MNDPMRALWDALDCQMRYKHIKSFQVACEQSRILFTPDHERRSVHHHGKSAIEAWCLLLVACRRTKARSPVIIQAADKYAWLRPGCQVGLAVLVGDETLLESFTQYSLHQYLVLV